MKPTDLLHSIPLVFRNLHLYPINYFIQIVYRLQITQIYKLFDLRTILGLFYRYVAQPTHNVKGLQYTCAGRGTYKSWLFYICAYFAIVNY